jgi:hypothetical protein
VLLRWGMLGLALGLTVGLTGCASAPWTATDKALLGFTVACHAVDYAQTEWGVENGYTEMNPLMGDAPSDGRILGTKLAMQALIVGAADYSENRAVSLGLALVPCVAAVAHNYSLGARP